MYPFVRRDAVTRLADWKVMSRVSSVVPDGEGVVHEALSERCGMCV